MQRVDGYCSCLVVEFFFAIFLNDALRFDVLNFDDLSGLGDYEIILLMMKMLLVSIICFDG